MKFYELHFHSQKMSYNNSFYILLSFETIQHDLLVVQHLVFYMPNDATEGLLMRCVICALASN